MKYPLQISRSDSLYIDQMRGISIIRVVLGHLGLFWIFPPYSEFFMSLLPLLFFTSGAVSILTYSRATSVKSYIRKRFIGLLTPFYLIAIISFLVLIIFSPSEVEVTTEKLVRWILINPSHSSMPYPLGQIWFLHSLAIILFFSPLIFSLMKRNIFYALVPISLSLVVSAVQFLYPIHDRLYVLNHNFYQPLSNAGFFFLGAMFYSTSKSFDMSFLVKLLALSTLTTITIACLPGIDIGLASHSYSPDLYYLSFSFSAIFLLLIAKPLIQEVFTKIKVLNTVVLYASKHSYGIFLIHSFFIFATEQWFGLKGVMGDPIRALLKISIVLAATAIAAPAITYVSKKLTKALTESHPKSKNTKAEKRAEGV